VAAVIAAAAALAVRPAGADEVDELAAQVFSLDQEARRLESFITEPQALPDAAERRLLDAQVLFEIEDYPRAGILFLDVVEKYPDSRVHEEALYYLAESLFRMRNLKSARAYYLQLAAMPQSPHYQPALARLVETALRTGETAGVDELIARMAEGASDPKRPEAPYVRAKYLYFRERTDEAMAAFDAIPDDHRYGRHARYFAAVCRVKKGDLDGAAQVFERLVRLKARSDGERRIQELADLALARVWYEAGRLRQAAAEYRRIPQKSNLYDTALYELAWVYVKDRQFDQALRALDLFMLARPDSPQVPEVRILQGNLYIRMKEFNRARDLFKKTHDDYDPQYRELFSIMAERRDPLPYLERLMGRMAEPGPAPELPHLAAVWAREQPGVQRSLDLLGDVEQIERDVAECTSILDRLEPAVRGPGRARIFPDLAEGQTRAARLQDRLLAARDRLIELLRARTSAAAGATEQDALERLGAERRSLAERMRRVPPPSAPPAEQAKTQSGYADAGKRLSEVSLRVASLRGQLAALDRYAAEHPPSEADAASFRQQAEGIRSLITTLSEEEAQLRAAIEEGQNATEAGDAGTAGEQTRRRYDDVLGEEHRLLGALVSRLDAPGQERARRIDQALAAVAAVQAELDRFFATLDARIEQRLVGIREAVESERKAVAELRAQTAAAGSEARDTGAAVARQSFTRVLRRFYDVSVQGDVGILDVAWARKQDKSDSVSELVNQQKFELGGVDEGFADVGGSGE
jgi:TolA-binding protein